MISIQDLDDGFYLCPGSISLLPIEFQQPGIVGSITKTPTKYLWNYNNNVISTKEGHAWDIYSKESNHVVLWNRVNSGECQQFDINANTISFRGNDKTVCVEKIVQLSTSLFTQFEIKIYDTKIHFVTYNALVGTKHYEDDLSQNVKDEYLRWDSKSGIRRELVRKAILNQDIMSLNEVTPKMLDFIVPSTHKFVYGARPDNISGSAIAFDSSRFELVDSMSELIIENMSHIVVSVLLQDRMENKIVCVTTLHLKAGYQDFERMRLEQTVIAMKIVEKWLNGRTEFQIVAGDLNSDRLEYPSLVKEELEKKGYDDVFDLYKGNRYVTYNHWQQSIFDYVFVKGFVGTDRFVPVSNELMPNANQGSDHFPVYCGLVYV